MTSGKGSDLASGLAGADLAYIKNDFWEILLKTKNEVSGLKEALINGKIDGSTYKGNCACLVGTIANVKHCEFSKIAGVAPNSKRPAERWFLAIRKNDTPESNVLAKITLGWIDEFETYLNI